ncbi:hypothetical protein LguiA_029575 [Lonicera macranthoides]
MSNATQVLINKGDQNDHSDLEEGKRRLILCSEKAESWAWDLSHFFHLTTFPIHLRRPWAVVLSNKGGMGADRAAGGAERSLEAFNLYCAMHMSAHNKVEWGAEAVIRCSAKYGHENGKE